jgi:hypothetical protein
VPGTAADGQNLGPVSGTAAAYATRHVRALPWHDSRVDKSENDTHEREADVLAQIGRCLFEQDLTVTVRLPVALAAAAQAAWDRDDASDFENETPAERTSRQQAGALALVGLALEEHGASNQGDEVEVTLDAWQIGSALDAADQRGLLTGLTPPDGRP